jgi:phosphonate transport system permease protein
MNGAGSAPPVWQRHTATQRFWRYVVYLVTVCAVVWSARTVDIIPEFLDDAPEQMKDLLLRMWPIDWAHYPNTIHDALVDTLHIATLGTLLGLLLALPVALLTARNITRSAPLNYLGKLILVASRSVNSLIWALFFVAVFGPGALAGTLAIAFRSIGFIGKLLSEALEEAPAGPIEALLATGASTPSLLSKGYWPQIAPAFWSVALFRWDINIRESAVLGLVGAGGIGMALDTAMNLFQWQRVAMVLIAIFAVVIVAELVVTYIRQQVL